MPTLKVSFQEALANRLHRVYLALLSVLLAAWVFRITAFTPPHLTWLEAAGIAYIPGMAVVTIISVFYVILVGIAFWPRERHAKGEFREGDHDKWKKTDQRIASESSPEVFALTADKYTLCLYRLSRHCLVEPIGLFGCLRDSNDL